VERSLSGIGSIFLMNVWLSMHLESANWPSFSGFTLDYFSKKKICTNAVPQWANHTCDWSNVRSALKGA